MSALHATVGAISFLSSSARNNSSQHDRLMTRSIRTGLLISMLMFARSSSAQFLDSGRENPIIKARSPGLPHDGSRKGKGY
jgi:hypothetical protein